MSELEVPYAAWIALQYVQDERDDEAVRAIATPVVAAKLRELATRTREMPSDVALLRAFLEREADELDGGAA